MAKWSGNITAAQVAEVFAAEDVAWSDINQLKTVNISLGTVTHTTVGKSTRSVSDRVRLHDWGVATTATLGVPPTARVNEIELTAFRLSDSESGTGGLHFSTIYIKGAAGTYYSTAIPAISSDPVITHADPNFGHAGNLLGSDFHSTEFGVVVYTTGLDTNTNQADGYQMRARWTWFIEADNLDVACTFGDVALTKHSKIAVPTADMGVVDPNFTDDAADPWIYNGAWVRDSVNNEADFEDLGSGSDNLAQIVRHAPPRNCIVELGITIQNYVSGSTDVRTSNLSANIISPAANANGSYTYKTFHGNLENMSIYGSLATAGANLSVTGLTYRIETLYPIIFGDVGLTYHPIGNVVLPVDTMAVSVTFNDIGLTAHKVLAADTLALSVDFGVVGFSHSRAVAADTMAVSVAFNAAGLTAHRLLSTDSMAVAANFGDVGLTLNRRITVDSAPIAIATNPVDLFASRILGADQLSVAITLNDVGLNYNPVNTATLPVDTMAIGVNFGDVGLRANRVLAADQVAIAVTLNDVGLRASRVLPVDPASYTITFNDVGLSTQTHITVDAMAIAVAFNAVDLNYNPINTSTLPVDTMAIGVAFGDVNLRARRVIAADQVDYAVTLNGVGLNYNPAMTSTLPVDTMPLAATFGDVGLTAHRVLGVDQASYSITLNDVGFQRNPAVVVDTLAVMTTFGDVSLRAHRVLSVDAATVTTTFNDVAFNVRRVLGVDPMSIAIAANDVGFRRHLVQKVDPMAVVVTFNDVTLFSGENLLPPVGTPIHIEARSGAINSGSRTDYVHSRVKNATILTSIKE